MEASAKDPAALPEALARTRHWALQVSAVAYVLLIVANTAVNKPSEWLPGCVMGLVMGPLAYLMLRGILKAQRFNVLTMRRKTYQGFIWFFWVFGVLFLALLMLILVRSPRAGISLSFGFTMAVGFCLAAANSWADGERFRE